MQQFSTPRSSSSSCLSRSDLLAAQKRKNRAAPGSFYSRAPPLLLLQGSLPCARLAGRVCCSSERSSRPRLNGLLPSQDASVAERPTFSLVLAQVTVAAPARIPLPMAAPTSLCSLFQLVGDAPSSSRVLLLSLRPYSSPAHLGFGPKLHGRRAAALWCSVAKSPCSMRSSSSLAPARPTTPSAGPLCFSCARVVALHCA